MQSKTIKKILHKEISNWIESIDNEEVQKLAKENTIVTGGCITSMLLKEDVNDYDIYFKTKEAAKVIAQYYVDKVSDPDVLVLDGKDENKEHFEKELDDDRVFIFIRSSGFFQKELIENEKHQLHFLSSNAITLTDKIQLVIRFWGEAKEIHENYDFIHATNYYDYSNNDLNLNKEALESILTKRLIYSGSLYPLTSIIRTKKFVKRGWDIGAGEYLKMCYQLSQLDLNDIDTLEEQLTGVDVAYFQHLIHALKEASKKETFKLSGSYLIALIDKIFNQ